MGHIATVLYKISLLENWGSGAKRIMDACKELKQAEPTWSTNGGFITVTFIRPNNTDSTQVVPKLNLSSTQAQKLIDLFDDTYVSVTEMMEAIGVKSRKYFREHLLNPAIQANIIEAKYPDNPRHPKQRYKLTKQALDRKDNKHTHQNNDDERRHI